MSLEIKGKIEVYIASNFKHIIQFQTIFSNHYYSHDETKINVNHIQSHKINLNCHFVWNSFFALKTSVAWTSSNCLLGSTDNGLFGMQNSNRSISI